MTAPTSRPLTLQGAVAAAVAAQTPERPAWVDPALEQVHRAMTDDFWFDGLPKTTQQNIWAKREQLIAGGYLDPTADTGASA